MNRREFLKTIVLALSALVLPKVKKEPEAEEMPKVYGISTAYGKKKWATYLTDEMVADVVTEDDVRKMFERERSWKPYRLTQLWDEEIT